MKPVNFFKNNFMNHRNRLLMPSGIIAFLFVAMFLFFYSNIATCATGSFTLVHIPDSQIMTQDYPSMYTKEMAWIKNNAGALNIKFVSHVGDVINSSTNTQYTNARNAMDQLNGVVPYGIAAGNHDKASDNFGLFNKYFPKSLFSGYSWFGGSYDSTILGNYALFSASGIDFLIINLRYQPPSAMMSWADGILKKYPNRMAIISTHDYMNTDASRTSYGNTIWNTIVKNNDNVFMVICGHMHGVNKRTDNNNFGHPVYQILADFQSETQRGTLRYYTFNFSDNLIHAHTIDTNTGNYRMDGANLFTLKIPFSTGPSVNTPPVANAQSVTTVKNTAKAITLTGSDVDGDALTYSITSSTTHGTLSGNAPNVTYTPATGYTGTDSFTFRVTDSKGATSGNAVVSITVSSSTSTGKVVLTTGQTLNSNLPVYSNNGQYRLIMQSDGNLVIYTSAGKAVWATGTNGTGGVRLVLQGDSNLVIYTSAGKAVWASNTVGTGANSLVLGDNGSLILYAGTKVIKQLH